ncbi:MAG: dihydroorotate dehydrogenase (NAD+) catalytic subunit [Candidatus Poriferisodalaceae bacterium]|jgi:dihydroorotate dehydrogenase (NAD+) catalytic subunit
MRRSAARSVGDAAGAVDLSTSVGSVVLPNPVMTASGTAGHAAELHSYVDLSALGAVVVKSLSPYAWDGNRAPRVHETAAGMINAVGLQNPGVTAWRENELPELVDTGARVVASIWGRSLDDYAAAGEQLAGINGVVAVEVNVSCPNVEDRFSMFAHAPDSAKAAIEAASACGLPMWAKLSPNVTDLVSIAEAVVEGGAEALTLTNTVMGLVIDPETLKPRLGNGGGGLSGPGIRPVAVRAVYEVYKAMPDVPIIGVGGIARAEHAVEFFAAGATAVQVGTATFADPKASTLVLEGLAAWCRDHDITSLDHLIGAAHDD